MEKPNNPARGRLVRALLAALPPALVLWLVLAGGTAPAGNGSRPDMAGLLDKVLAEEVRPGSIPLKPVSPVNRVTFRTRSGNAASPCLTVPVSAEPVKGNLPEPAFVYHVIGPVWQTPAPYAVPYWQGPDSAMVGPLTITGYQGTLNAGPFVPPVAETATLPVHTLAGSARAARENGDWVVWGDLGTTSPEDAVTVNVETLDAAWVDPDDNGLPRALFETVGPGICWAAVTRGQGGGYRTVCARRVEDGSTDKADGGMVTLQPRDNITVVVPGLSLLAGAGLVDADDEVIAVVEVADAPEDLIDAVTGSTYADVADWAEAVRQAIPGTLPENAPYVQVTLVSRNRGVLEDLGSLFCSLVISGLRFPADAADAGVSVQGVSTLLDQVEENGNGIFTSHPDLPLWRLADARPTVSRDNGVVLTRVNMAGAFVPVISALRVTACVPPVLPPDLPVPVTLLGRFPVTGGADPEAGLTLAEAGDALEVFFADENGTETTWIPAALRAVNTPAGTVAVTPPGADGYNLLFITSPDLSGLLGEAAQRPVSILVRSRNNPGDAYLFRGTQVRATATLETTTSGDGSGTVSIVVSQPEYGLENVVELGDSSALALGTGTFWAGARVTATARPDDRSALTGWLVNDVNRGDGTVNPLTFTLGVGENTLEAQFHPLVTDRYRLNLDTVSGGVVTVTPAQPATGYPAGTSVSLAAMPGAGYRFVRWTGDLAGVADPAQSLITVIMNADRTVGAVMIPETNRYLLLDDPGPGGTISADPPLSAAGYLPGVAVTLAATANGLYVFDRWTGDVDDPQANPTVVVMDADRQVGALFHPPVRLVVTSGTGGTVSAETVPSGETPAKNVDTLFPHGATVRLVATPAPRYVFSQWTGPGATLLADPTSPIQEITLSGDVTLEATFESSFDVEAVEPSWAWIFGGVTATIHGKGLRDGMTAMFDGVAATLYNAAPDGTSAVVEVPSFADRAPGLSSLTVTLRVRDGEAETPGGVTFTYLRYQASPTDGTLVMAFTLPDTSVPAVVPLLAENGDLDTATLEVPALNLAGPLHGIVLLRRIAAASAKVDTAVPSGSLAGSLIDAPGTLDAGVPGLYDFSVYFYQASGAERPSVGGKPTLESADATVTAALSRGRTPDGTPTSGTPLRITLPAGQSNLTYAILRAGLRTFGVVSRYDYLAGTESREEPVSPRYESVVLNEEINPTPDQVSAATARPETVTARVYAPGGFRLVQGALLSDRAAGLVKIAKVNGLPGATPRGPKAGGTVLTLHAAEGGLAYVDRVELVAADGRRVTVNESRFITRTGTDEYVFEFRVPRAGFTGVTDLYVYLESDPGQPAVVLQRAFEYTPNPLGAMPFFLLLLALLSVVIGLAFGL